MSIHDSLGDLHGYVAAHIRKVSGGLAVITSVELPQTMPALVAAYEEFEDASRDVEIISRNGVRHPSFVPARTALEVLSS